MNQFKNTFSHGHIQVHYVFCFPPREKNGLILIFSLFPITLALSLDSFGTFYSQLFVFTY